MTNKLLTLIALVTVGAAQMNAAETWSARMSNAGQRVGEFIDNNRGALETGAQKVWDRAQALRGAAESRMAGANGGGVRRMYEVVRSVGFGAAEGDLSFEPTSVQYQEYCKDAKCILRRSVTGTLAAENHDPAKTNYVGTSEENGNKLGIIETAEVSIMPVAENNEVSTMPVENDMATMPARMYNAIVR